ncbi:hypothetical protein S225a_12020 [Candidatus Brocadiaceae bacterium S225]|nr:hypothetical protein S225a_12020 [Candidatus Brocadiaceae bacterium S225]
MLAKGFNIVRLIVYFFNVVFSPLDSTGKYPEKEAWI